MFDILCIRYVLGYAHMCLLSFLLRMFRCLRAIEVFGRVRVVQKRNKNKIMIHLLFNFRLCY
jgi:hypothetical protein